MIRGCFHFWNPTYVFTTMLNVENHTYKYTKYVKIMCTFLYNNIGCQIYINTINISIWCIKSWSHFTKLSKYWSHFRIFIKRWNIKIYSSNLDPISRNYSNIDPTSWFPSNIKTSNVFLKSWYHLMKLSKHWSYYRILSNIETSNIFFKSWFYLQIMIPFTNYSNADPTLEYLSNISKHTYTSNLYHISPTSGYSSSFFLQSNIICSIFVEN